MRKVNYIAKKSNGTLFMTTSYAKATENGNRIVKTELLTVSENYLDAPDEIKAKEKEQERFERIRLRRINKRKNK